MVKCSSVTINMHVVNKSPTPAANLLGARSVGLFLIFNWLIATSLKIASKLYLPRLFTLNKKSSIKKAIISHKPVTKKTVPNTKTKKAVNRALFSLINTKSTGH